MENKMAADDSRMESEASGYGIEGHIEDGKGETGADGSSSVLGALGLLFPNMMSQRPREVAQLNPLVLAFMGDAVYDLFMRSRVLLAGKGSVNRMHRQASVWVCAGMQARMLRLLEPELTAAEVALYKRGRNQKQHTMAKNASIGDYKMATGLECLLGWLYLSGQGKRAVALLERGCGLIEADREAQEAREAEIHG